MTAEKPIWFWEHLAKDPESGSDDIHEALDAEERRMQDDPRVKYGISARWPVTAAVASRDDIPLDVAQRLSQHPEWSVRGLLARRPQAPPEVIDVLASDDKATIRAFAAGNPACPPDTLERLAHDETDPLVVAEVAANPNTPEAARAFAALRAEPA